MIRPTSNSDGVCLPRSAVGLRDSRLSRVWKRSDVLCDRSSNSFRKRANCVCVIEYDTFSHGPPHSLASFFLYVAVVAAACAIIDGFQHVMWLHNQ